MASKRKLSAKQIKAGFGGKRRQTNARKRRRNTAKRRPAARKQHRVRTTPNPAPRKRRRKSGAARRKNAGALLALTGNPAKKGKSKMARSRKRKNRAASSRKNAGYTRRRTKRNTSHRRRRNPGEFGDPMIWLSGAAGVLTGVVATRGLPQLVRRAPRVPAEQSLRGLGPGGRRGSAPVAHHHRLQLAWQLFLTGSAGKRHGRLRDEFQLADSAVLGPRQHESVADGRRANADEYELGGGRHQRHGRRRHGRFRLPILTSRVQGGASRVGAP